MKAMPPDDWQPLERTVPKDLFKSEVVAWARRIGVEFKELHVRSMKRKWGSLFEVGANKGGGRRTEGNLLNCKVTVPIPGM